LRREEYLGILPCGISWPSPQTAETAFSDRVIHPGRLLIGYLAGSLLDSSKKEAIFFSGLVGEWRVQTKKDSDEDHSRWIFRRSDDSSGYQVTTFDTERHGSSRSSFTS